MNARPTPSRRRWLRAAAATAAVVTAPRLQAADPAFPSRPLAFVVPFSPGGQFDTLARQIARPLSADLGQPVVVENIGGAGGNIAASKVSRAKPDGHTLLMYGGNIAIARSMYRKLDYDPLGDFQMVSRVSIAPHVVMASPGSGITRFDQVLDRLKRGARLAYGSPGVGSSMHLTFEIIKEHFGLDIVHVPYKGGANVMTDLVGSQIDLALIAVGPALEFIQAGKVAALGVTSQGRSPALPQVPAFAELGMPALDAGSWSGIALPKDTPAAIVERLNAAVVAAVRSPEVSRLFAEQGFVAITGTPDEMRRFAAADAERFDPIIRKLALQQS